MNAKETVKALLTSPWGWRATRPLRPRGTALIMYHRVGPLEDTFPTFDIRVFRAQMEWLKARCVTDLFVCGLATDYCVKFTVLDGRALGFNVSVVEDACRGVNLKADDSNVAIDAMKAAGVRIIRAAEVPQ